MILKLIGMLALGLISSVLSFYNKNFYVRIFNDILGREEDEDTATRVGRGFFYGFFFPVYFVLILAGLISLISFLVVAGIIAAIVFVIVWITEKILPNEWVGKLVMDLLAKVGFRSPQETSNQTASSPCCSTAENANVNKGTTDTNARSKE